MLYSVDMLWQNLCAAAIHFRWVCRHSVFAFVCFSAKKNRKFFMHSVCWWLLSLTQWAEELCRKLRDVIWSHVWNSGSNTYCLKRRNWVVNVIVATSQFIVSMEKTVFTVTFVWKSFQHLFHRSCLVKTQFLPKETNFKHLDKSCRITFILNRLKMPSQEVDEKRILVKKLFNWKLKLLFVATKFI